MFVSNDAIYVNKPEGYVRCVLCKDSAGNYYLHETKAVLKRMLMGYMPVTWQELIARYGPMAGDPPQEPKESGEKGER